MNTLNIKSFREGMVNGGIWVLTEASSTMQGYVRKEFPPEKYEEEIVKYRTPTKYIKEGNTITIVAVSDYNWVGITQYDINNTLFREYEDEIVVMLEGRTAKYRLGLSSGIEVQEKLIEEMIKTGYITREEWDKYIDPESHKELTKITKSIL